MPENKNDVARRIRPSDLFDFMSYCQLIIFKDGKPSYGIEYRNAWGGAARIWDALFEKHLKNPNIPYHSWISGDQQPLWDLAKRETLPMHERAVHASTFDHAYVRRENFPRFCADLRAFDAAYPSGPKVSHLSAWADALEKLDAEAIGFYGTSVAENPWMKYDEAKDESIPVPLSDGWELYDWLDKSNAKLTA